MYKTANQIADTVLEKCAAISREDIARGLSGTTARDDITDDEIQQYGQGTYDHRYDATSSRPWIGGGLGALAGGALGAVKGAPGAAIGAGIGGLAGAGLGQLTRYPSANAARSLAEGLGRVAQKGRIPYDVPGHELQDYPQFADGTQEDRIDPEALEKFVARAQQRKKEKAIAGALRGAVIGNMSSDQNADSDELRNTAIGGVAGGLRGWQGGEEAMGRQTDLYERGYGHLADTMQRRDVAY